MRAKTKRPWTARRAEQKRASIARHPERKRARAAVETALKSGRLVRKPCEAWCSQMVGRSPQPFIFRCGRLPTHAHHEDYSKPLDVRWFCRLHHDEVHGR